MESVNFCNQLANITPRKPSKSAVLLCAIFIFHTYAIKSATDITQNNWIISYINTLLISLSFRAQRVQKKKKKRKKTTQKHTAHWQQQTKHCQALCSLQCAQHIQYTTCVYLLWKYMYLLYTINVERMYIYIQCRRIAWWHVLCHWITAFFAYFFPFLPFIESRWQYFEIEKILILFSPKLFFFLFKIHCLIF